MVITFYKGHLNSGNLKEHKSIISDTLFLTTQKCNHHCRDITMLLTVISGNCSNGTFSLLINPQHFCYYCSATSKFSVLSYSQMLNMICWIKFNLHLNSLVILCVFDFNFLFFLTSPSMDEPSTKSPINERIVCS